MPASPNPVNVVMSKAIKSGQASASQRMVIRFADRQRAIFYRAENFAPSCRLDSVEHRIGEQREIDGTAELLSTLACTAGAAR
jgi:hypothetical protein